MRRKSIFMFFLVFMFFSFSLYSYKTCYNSFFGVFGKGSSIMGKVNGKQLEVWIYPYKLVSDFKFLVKIDGKTINPYEKILEYKIKDEYFERVYAYESFIVREKIFSSLKAPASFIIYEISSGKDFYMIFEFKPELSPMWPAAIGGKFSFYDGDGFYVLGEAKWKNFGFIGFKEGIPLGRLPAHKLSENKLRYEISVNKGKKRIIIPFFAGYGDYEKLKKSFIRLRDKAFLELKKRISHFNHIKNSYLSIKSSDKELEYLINTSIPKIESGFVKNPFLGEALVAGYDLSGVSERPGFAWFFGGDASINSLSILDYGNFDGVRKVIEFLFKYQRKDGKIPHEISQGARFIEWFKDYGFPYFHGDTTLYFSILLSEYIKRTGDLELIKKHENSLDLIFSWIKKCDFNGDGIVESKLAGVGASETGPLRREKIVTDILLAGLSVKALREIAFLYKVLGKSKKSHEAMKLSNKAYRALNELFWNKETQYFDYAIKERERVSHITVWPSIALRFNVIKKEKGKKSILRIASPELSTDWGIRFLSNKSPYYSPLSYNNGAVWPFLTGFSAHALFNYGNPIHGYMLLKSNCYVLKNFDCGYGEELFSGDRFLKVEQAVSHQIWSYGTGLSAFVEGMLGFKGNVLEKRINLSPFILPFIEAIEVKNIRIGNGKFDFNYSFKGKEVFYTFKFLNLKGYKFIFEPILMNNAIEKSSFYIKENYYKIKKKIKLKEFIYPVFERRVEPGESSDDLILSRVDKRGEYFVFGIWGKGKKRIRLISSDRVLCNGIKVDNRGEIELNFSNESYKYREIFCKLKGGNNGKMEY